MIPIILGNLAASALDVISNATHSHGPAKKDRFDDVLSQVQQTHEPDDSPAPGADATSKKA